MLLYIYTRHNLTASPSTLRSAVNLKLGINLLIVVQWKYSIFSRRPLVPAYKEFL